VGRSGKNITGLLPGRRERSTLQCLSEAKKQEKETEEKEQKVPK
jgi:hypothetical protein